MRSLPTPSPVEASLLWVRAFLRREWPLVLPVALAFLALPPLLFALALPPSLLEVRMQSLADMQDLSATLPGWVRPAVIACGLVTALGALAVTALALVPRISVREAIGLALRRLPAWVGASVLVGLILCVALVAAGTALVLLGVSPSLLALPIVLVLLATGLFLVLLLPVLVHAPAGPIAAIRRGWATWRPGLGRVAAACVLVWAGSWLVTFALQKSLGAVLLLAARLAGQADAGQVLATLWVTLLGALQWAFFYLFVAALYRVRVEASRGI